LPPRHIRELERDPEKACSAPGKRGGRFSEKIMLKQQARDSDSIASDPAFQAYYAVLKEA
jgi:hypothetical protein